MAIEILRRYAPSLLVVNLSDVEVAHFGSFSMHLAGIRNTDRLIYELWQEISGNPEIMVDLLDVSFVDDAGHELLSEMRRGGAELIGSGPLMSALIDEIEEAEASTSNA